MKLTTTFSHPPGRLVLPLAAILWGCALAAGGFSLSLVWETEGLSQRLPVLQKQLNALAARRAALDVEPASHTAELRSLQQRVALLNGLAEPNTGSPDEMLERVDSLLPDAVSLLSFRYHAPDGEAALVAESWSVQPLTKFLDRLERQPRFSEVLLTRESRRETGAGQPLYRFELRIFERHP